MEKASNSGEAEREHDCSESSTCPRAAISKIPDHNFRAISLSLWTQRQSETNDELRNYLGMYFNSYITKYVIYYIDICLRIPSVLQSAEITPRVRKRFEAQVAYVFLVIFKTLTYHRRRQRQIYKWWTKWDGFTLNIVLILMNPYGFRWIQKSLEVVT